LSIKCQYFRQIFRRKYIYNLGLWSGIVCLLIHISLVPEKASQRMSPLCAYGFKVYPFVWNFDIMIFPTQVLNIYPRHNLQWQNFVLLTKGVDSMKLPRPKLKDKTKFGQI
jgi:hypothetical protein